MIQFLLSCFAGNSNASSTMLSAVELTLLSLFILLVIIGIIIVIVVVISKRSNNSEKESEADVNGPTTAPDSPGK